MTIRIKQHQVEGLPEALEGKADDGHTHPGGGPHAHDAADVTYAGAATGTNVEEALDGLKGEVDGKAADGHGHAAPDASAVPYTGAVTADDVAEALDVLWGLIDSHTHPGGGGGTALVPLTATEAGEPTLVWTEDDELVLVEVPL